jgi:hypothetical protein
MRSVSMESRHGQPRREHDCADPNARGTPDDVTRRVRSGLQPRGAWNVHICALRQRQTRSKPYIVGRSKTQLWGRQVWDATFS